MTEILLRREAALQPAADAAPRVRAANPAVPEPAPDRGGCRVQLPFLREVFTRFEREQTLQERREARLRRARAEFGLD